MAGRTKIPAAMALIFCPSNNLYVIDLGKMKENK
jgi:hypothetical protein